MTDEPISPADETAVSALLSSVGGPTQMPAEVAARIDAALAAERDSVATVTPLVPRQRRWSRPLLGLAAAASIVLVGGVAVTTLNDSDSGADQSALEAGGAVTDDAASLARSTSGRDYSPTTLPRSVDDLLGTGAATLAEPAAPSAEATPPSAALEAEDADADAAKASSLVLDETLLAPCLERVAGEERQVVAVDAGSYEGNPAVAVVLAAGDDAVDVYIVTPDCSADDASILHFERVEQE